MAAPASPRGGFSAEDLAGLSAEERRRLLERNPHLADVFAEGDKAARREPTAPRPPAREASAGPAGAAQPPAAPSKAASGRAKDRRPGSRPGAPGRRGASSARRLGRRVVRETPGLPGPGATSLLLTFVGSTLAIVGLVLILEGGPAFARLPAAVGTFAGKLTDPHDPIF